LKRSLLENFLRDGPPSGDPREGLQELKYLVLSSRVDADGDGMVSFNTIYEIVILIKRMAVTVPNLPLADSPRHPTYANR
jgi:cell cycle arrest protein BUB2